jgi:hypothetical protein
MQELEMLKAFTMKAVAAALVLAGAGLGSPVPTAAGESTGTWRNGMVEGPFGPGYYRGAPGGAYVRPDYDDGYRGAAVYGGRDCYVQRERVVDEWVVVRRTRVCE